MRFFVATDKGIKRQINEDFVFATDQKTGILPNLFIVADGMGGHKAGDEASSLAVYSLLEYVRNSNGTDLKSVLTDAITHANHAILSASRSDAKKEGMGTTILCTTIGEKVTMASIGDSRIYVSGKTGFYQVTRDHTVVGEMLRMGSISKDLAKRHPKRHMLTKALGVVESVEADFFEESLANTDHILMCTDGLYSLLSDEEIETVIKMPVDISVRARRLVEIANEKGGEDNITVLLIDTNNNL